MHPTRPFRPVVITLCMVLLAACTQSIGGPPEVEQQSAAHSMTIVFPSSISLNLDDDESMEEVHFTGSIHLVADCKGATSTCRFHTNLAAVDGVGQSSGKSYRVTGSSQYSFDRLPPGSYEFIGTFDLLPHDPLNPRLSLLFEVSLDSSGRITTATATPHDVIIPDTTKVADGDMRAALTSYDSDSGVMRFSRNTPVLQNLRRGDVLVSEPSSAAPEGYLRRVTAVRRSSGEVVLETVQATLTEAITQGGFSQEGDFVADDVVRVDVHLDGVSVGSVAPESGEVARLVGVGSQFRLPHLEFDAVMLDFGGTQVRLNGEFFFNAGWGVNLDIRTCWELPPVCLRSFEAKVGFEERLKIELSGAANGSLGQEIKIATYYFDTLVFFIGPVPVVVTTSVDVYIGASGEVRLEFKYGVTQEATAQLGARWTPKGGWQNISGSNFEAKGYDNIDGAATMKARAYAKAVFSMKLYDVAGPALGLILAAELDVGIPRDPIWILQGTVEGYIAFVLGLPILGKLSEHKATLFVESKELARAPNQPPRFSNYNSEVTHAVNVNQSMLIGPRGGLMGGYFDVMDPEGHAFTLSATSTADGTIATNAAPPLNYVFRTLGKRTLTITARDSKNAVSQSISLKFDVKSVPPGIRTYVPSTEVPQDVEYHISLRAIVPNAPDLPCNRLTWSPSAAYTVTTPEPWGGACRAVAVFHAQGQHSLTVTATTTDNISTSKTLHVSVGPPPSIPAPQITNITFSALSTPPRPDCLDGYCEVVEGAEIYGGPGTTGAFEPPLYFRVHTAPSTGLTVEWTCSQGGQSLPVTHGADGLANCGGDGFAPTGTIVVRVVVSNGTSAVQAGRSFDTSITDLH